MGGHLSQVGIKAKSANKDLLFVTKGTIVFENNAEGLRVTPCNISGSLDMYL